MRAPLGAPVAIFGGGVSGAGIGVLLAATGAAGAVYDAKGTEFTAAAALRHKLVVFSPGFAPDHPWLKRAAAAGCVCLAEIDFAALFWRGKIVAVTGTNGKTSLTEFLAQALNGSGREAHAAGNIGMPLSRLAAEKAGGAAEATAVCEVSSFQAEALRHFRADATLWTNFAEDHLERHSGLEAYFSAKWELVRRTPADRFFAGSSVQRAAEQFGRTLPGPARVATEGQPEDPFLEGSPFAAYPQRENFILAAAWWKAEGLEQAELYAAASRFRLGRHRLARVGEVAGIVFWNDSKATNFHAVEAALARFHSPVQWIAGGKSKGGDVAAFVRRIAPRIRRAYLIGETKAVLSAACAAAGVPCTECATLEDAVGRAAGDAAGAGHVLLSPGFASFDMFRSYEDRGDRFEQAVRSLGLRFSPSTDRIPSFSHTFP